MPLFKGIEEPKRTQVITKGLALSELVKDEILNELDKKFSEYDIATAQITFGLTKKTKPIELKDEEGKKIFFEEVDTIELKHPTPRDYRNKIVVITCNRNKILEKFLE